MSKPGEIVLTGTWLSSYTYTSSSRGGTYSSQDQVIVSQDGDRVTVRSVPDSPNEITMTLSLTGTILTGTWAERTDPDGPYEGYRYWGVVQFLASPDGRVLTGRWLGHSRNGDVINDGVWELVRAAEG